MAGVLQELLHEHIGLAERRFRLGSRPPIGVLHGAGFAHDAHAPATAAASRLEEHGRVRRQRIEKSPRRSQIDGFRKAGHHRHVVRLGQAPGARLVAEQRQRLGGGPDEVDVLLGAQLRERRVFAEKAVAGMHRVAVGLPRPPNNGVHVEVGASALAGQRRRGVGPAHMQRARIVRAEDRHGGDVQFRGGPGDADGDFAAVGDEQLHGTRMLRPNLRAKRRNIPQAA